MDRVFLDANVLFSAAYRADSGLATLWARSGTQLVSSRYAALEAGLNLPHESQRLRLEQLMRNVEIVAESGDQALPRGIVLPAKDRPILVAAVCGGCTHLLTGDVRHFGKLLGKTVAGVLILRPAEYLSP